MRWLLVSPILALSAPVAAQTTFTGGDFDIDWHTPGDLDCEQPGSGCDPMNRAECSDTATQTRAIEVTVNVRNGGTLLLPAGEGKVYVWVEQETSTDAECGFDGGTSEVQIGQSISVTSFRGGPLLTEPLSFPEDVDESLSLTVAELMAGSGDVTSTVVENACGDPGIEETYRLCFGLDISSTSGLGGPDGKVEPSGTLNEPSGWIRLVVDTVPPPDVSSATAVGGEGVLRIRPQEAGETDSADRWKVIMRPAADAANPDGSTCRDWTGGGIIVDDDTLASQSEVAVRASNWVTYEGCVMLVDQVGNEGEPATFSGTPINECDFIECFPGDGLEGGYCGAGAPVSLAGALALLLLRRARRRGRAS